MDKVDGLSFKICKKFTLNKETMRCGPDFPFILIWGWALTVWSTLTGLDWESKRGLLLGFCNQALASIRSNTIHMFYRQDLRGVVNAIKRQHTPQHQSCSLSHWPSARRPSKTQLWHRMSDCSRKCFRRAVKVCTGGSRALNMRMTCAVAEQIQQLSRVWGPNGQGFKSRL